MLEVKTPLTVKGYPTPEADLSKYGLTEGTIHWNLTPAELTEITLNNGMGQLSANGTLAVDTGEFTGRSPKDRFIVKDDITSERVDWGNVNLPIAPEYFDGLYDKVIAYLNGKEMYVRDAFACSNPDYRLKVRVINELPWQNAFAHNMFIRPKGNDLKGFEPDWTVIAAPGLMADPTVDGTRQHNFAIINFSKQIIIIGGTAYTGEIKKGIFSVLNFLLPTTKNVLSMHCSANVGPKEDTAIFFGLSGTGKTTLSADPERRLIGDDEHGWANGNVFNFEGGCYAKCVNLDPESEPEIYSAIRFGAMLENINFKEGGREVDFEDTSKTQNTRVSYPIHHLPNTVHSQMGGNPRNIFFLTCDAFGVLPPISKLSEAQAKYHFISGYTAKIAGTEEGITEPQVVFSACFGAPFLPLHPAEYADMLGEKLSSGNVNVWLVNTGWSGGPYGVGSRIKLKYTRAMINAALDGVLENVAYHTDPVFGLRVPVKCPGTPSALLNPPSTWDDEEAYYVKAKDLAAKFNANFEQFKEQTSEDTRMAAPKGE